METAEHKARFDWLVELAGAAALAVAAGYAALKVAPSLAWPAPVAMTASSLGFFAFGLLAMRAVRPDPRGHVLPEIRIDPFVGELLLDQVAEEELLLVDVFKDDALLLEDPLPAPGPDSRVVQLFAAPPLPTPGQLSERIDRHLAGGPRMVPGDWARAPDASGALFAALDDLRRSLR